MWNKASEFISDVPEMEPFSEPCSDVTMTYNVKLGKLSIPEHNVYVLFSYNNHLCEQN